MADFAYITGAAVTRTLPLFGVDGQTISAVSADLELRDTNEAGVLIASQTLSVSPGATELSYSIDASFNTLNELTERLDGRHVIITVIDADGNTHILQDRYLLRTLEPYISGVDIAAPLIDYSLAAYQSGHDFWDNLPDSKKEAIMLKQFAKMKALRFKVCGFNNDNPFRICDLTEEEYAELPFKFRGALICASLSQAEFEQTCSSYEQMRDSGITFSSDSSGSVTSFRQTKPMELPFTKEAMAALKGYIVWGTYGLQRR